MKKASSYELNVEESRKNTPPLASMDASGSLADNGLGASSGMPKGTAARGKRRRC